MGNEEHQTRNECFSAGARLEWPRHCLLISLKGERYVAYMCTRCAPDTTARRARSATTVTSSGSDGSDDDSGGGGGGGDSGGNSGDVDCCGSGGTTDTPRLSSAILVRRLDAAVAIAVVVIIVIVAVICTTNTLQRTVTVSLDTFSLRVDRTDGRCTPRNICFTRDLCFEISPHDVLLAFSNLYLLLLRLCCAIIGCQIGIERQIEFFFSLVRSLH